MTSGINAAGCVGGGLTAVVVTGIVVGEAVVGATVTGVVVVMVALLVGGVVVLVPDPGSGDDPAQADTRAPDTQLSQRERSGAGPAASRWQTRCRSLMWGEQQQVVVVYQVDGQRIQQLMTSFGLLSSCSCIRNRTPPTIGPLSPDAWRLTVTAAA